MENYPSDSQVPTIILSSPSSVDECCAMYPLVNNTYDHMDVYQMISLFSQMLLQKSHFCNCTHYPHLCPQMAGQIDMNRQSDLMAAFEEQCGK